MIREKKEFFVDANGIDIFVRHHPATQNPHKTILFLHGYKDASPTFDPIINSLPNNISCYSFDFRGHGKSARLTHARSAHLLDHLKDLSFILNQINKLDLLIGHSMGANICLLFALAMPELANKIMLIDALGPPGENFEEIPERFKILLKNINIKKQEIIFDTYEQAKSKIKQTNPNINKDTLDHLASYLITQASESKFKFTHDSKLNGPTPYRFSEKAWKYLLSQIKQKLIIITPEHGVINKHKNYAQRINYFSHKQEYFFAHATHQVHIERAQEIAQIIITELEKKD